jgi:IS5 family transposase
VGKTKRGKGTKLIAVTDAAGLVLSVTIESASPHEVGLVEKVPQERFVEPFPERLTGDRAYDSDPLDARLKEKGVEMIAPHRKNRRKKKTQDGRKLRRYK